MKKISLEQLQRESRTESYPEQYRYICAQIEENKIMPVKNSPLNGKKPALHTSYWLVEEKPDYGEEIAELQFQTVPAIRTDYYLKNPEVYRQERNWVRLLNRFFLERSEAGSRNLSPASLNERSFQIWGREKFLQRGGRSWPTAESAWRSCMSTAPQSLWPITPAPARFPRPY